METEVRVTEGERKGARTDLRNGPGLAPTGGKDVLGDMETQVVCCAHVED